MTDLNWGWFCVRSQQKHELVAARHLRLLDQVSVFNPRIHFARPIRQRKVWVTQPLFPGYLFARFNWRESLCKVYYAPGVQCVVHFGNGWPTVPEPVIEEIRALVGPNETYVLSEEVSPGEEVQIIGDSFEGLSAVVTQVLPGRQRVALLLEFLGRQTTIEIGIHSIIKQRIRR
jgi:transcriptional antiterminator RfaH